MRPCPPTTVPIKDLGEIDPAWAGIFSPTYERSTVFRYVHEQFLEDAADYVEKYQSISYWKYLFEKAQSLFSLDSREDLWILDLGSGGGNTVFPLLELYPRAKVIASDLSVPLLKVLREHLIEHYPNRSCCLLQLNAEELIFEGGQFDLVAGGAILHHLFAPEKAIDESYRVLKPGGVAVFFEPFECGHQLVASTMRNLVERTTGRRLSKTRLLPARVENAFLPLRKLLGAKWEIPPEVIHFFGERYREIQLRTGTDKSKPVFRRLDDKWLFTRGFIYDCARASGFSEVEIFPLNESSTPVYDHVRAFLRIGLGLDESVLPPQAIQVIRDADESLSPEARREHLIEGGIVLKKPL